MRTNQKQASTLLLLLLVHRGVGFGPDQHPTPTALWEFSGSTPLTDLMHGYTLQQHNLSQPVVILPASSFNGSGAISHAAAFGWESHATWKECNGPCGNRLYVGLSHDDALQTVSSLLQLCFISSNPLHDKDALVAVFSPARCSIHFGTKPNTLTQCNTNY
jgi:hypothetical protein